ncbi:glycosyltransferase [Geodermatophilus poikilotrophus]|uniref:Glycosyl transferases group 1 n=1 Tax=Geodermatophilus poikilotrophus TaxID=1333667 RepID=A0A1H9ZT54_9ACTN|nr:glycosyltransferase [Geodermatophilus poikilotrophus]SES84944.1 Glycosyl transferases group 1 [Geodermatophilus poikilotrophus]
MATVPGAPRRLLCVAPLVPAGGVDTLLTAFGILAGDRPDLTVQVVGGGPLSRALRAHADHLGVADRVVFCGPMRAPAVRTAVRRCAVLVLPHRDHGAGAGPAADVALLEARVTGCPVVATRQAAPHLTSRVAGSLVPAGAPTALAQALEATLGVPVRTDPGASAATASTPGGDRHLLRRAWNRVVR